MLQANQRKCELDKRWPVWDGEFDSGDQLWEYHSELGYLCERQQRQIAYLRSSFIEFTQYRPVLFHLDLAVQDGFEAVILSPESTQYFEEVRQGALKAHLEFYFNDVFYKAAPLKHDGQYYYYKRFLSADHINKYLYMQEIGIGVQVLWYSHELGEIVMEAGIVLETFVRCKMNVPELQKTLIDQINFIQITLRRIGVAHCDIKPENMIVVNSPTGVRVHLIDMDDAVLFGQIRYIGTLTRNVMDFQDNLGLPTDENTDQLGFQYTKNYLFIENFKELPMIVF